MSSQWSEAAAGHCQQPQAKATDSMEASENSVEACNVRQKQQQPNGCQECARKQAEIELLREELRALESEMEEMHDSFKEEESEQFEHVKQELDVALKNCKILQIKLGKCERQYGQLEQVKTMLEQQLIEQQSNQDGGECQRSKQEFASTQVLFELGPGQEFVKVPTREYDQLLRDLNDLSERERDLQEQIKFSQEEAQLKGERLQAVECENEVLLGRINKLTNANSSLRTTLLSNDNQRTGSGGSATTTDSRQQTRELVEQNEQLKLALELAQADSGRLRTRLAEIQQQQQQAGPTSPPADQQEASSKMFHKEATESEQEDKAADQSSIKRALEQECRQLRARLVRHEREQRQFRAQLEALRHDGGKNSTSQTGAAGNQLLQLGLRSRSVEESEQCKATSKCQARIRQLSEQCEQRANRVRELEERLASIGASKFEAASDSQLEKDLLDKLKRQLDFSDGELAKARSRLVELDIECSKAQRQYKRLLDSFETCGSNSELQSVAARRLRLPSEPMRDAMSRADLRQALRELESDLDELSSMVRAKECLAREHQQELASLRQRLASASSQAEPSEPTVDATNKMESQQVRSLHRIIDQERLLSNNLKLDVAKLESERHELQTRCQMYERERASIDEELDKLRKLTGEQRAQLDENEHQKIAMEKNTRELSEKVDRLRLELADAQRVDRKDQEGTKEAPGGPAELLPVARDLSELKMKNGFLMRQLEVARDEAQRQSEEERKTYQLQQRRAVELAQLELREKHLAESQQMKEELGEWRQKLANAQRQLAHNEEELALERERARALERDWRRDKSQWQQAREQLEGQLSIERRSGDFRLKEMEVSIRDRERANLSLQDKCVQLERDLKRLQNKLQLLEEDYESRLKSLGRELELKSRELADSSGRLETLEAQNFGQLKKLTEDNRRLGEALDSLKQSYNCKLAEARKLREMLAARQEQAYRERQQQAEQVADLLRRLGEAQEAETQAKLLRQRLEALERQLDGARRELSQAREERAKLRARCEELEKRELISRTSHIASSSILRPFVGHARPQSPVRATSDTMARSSSLAAARAKAQGEQDQDKQDKQDSSMQTVEKLSGKINDQRNLIQMLRQQLSETQLDLKQMKLLQASERSKWQTRTTILTSRLNECEERLAFEMTSGWFGTNEESENCEKQVSAWTRGVKTKLELQFETERRIQLELIQQQQAQIDSLARDLRKVSQAHDMLRLHSKQLESSNNKLSKKLIEFQQQQPLVALAQSELEARHERLTRTNAKLRAEMRPLVEIVAKMVASLDAPEQQTQAKNDSTNRPLRAPTPGARTSDDDADNEPLSVSVDVQQQQQQQQQSRLSRLLAGSRTAPSGAWRAPSTPRSAESAGSKEDAYSRQATRRVTTKKPAKRVRIKCSSLGITTSEKRQLKQQLKALRETLDEQIPVDARQQQQQQQHSSSKRQEQPSQPAAAAIKWQQPMVLTNASRPLLLQPDSDLDSERSWSLEPARLGQHQLTDMYRRFPQTTVGSRARASLTDYESESSIASDLVRGPGVSGGAESDSGISPGALGHTKSKAKHKGGIRSRVTNTLRTISRSIQGIASAQASDSEDDNGRASARSTLSEIRV